MAYPDCRGKEAVKRVSVGLSFETRLLLRQNAVHCNWRIGTGRFRRAWFRRGGEDESVSMYVRGAVFRRDEVQAEAARGTSRG